MITVIKRDGREAEYRQVLIVKAIVKAMASVKVVDDGWAVCIAEEIESQLGSRVTVKEIQTYIEDALMEHHPTVARAYIEYRHDRDKAREEDSTLHKRVMSLINRTDDTILNENSNKDSRVLHTQRDLLAGLVCKHYGLEHILPERVAKAHKDGDLHYHDLDYSPFFNITNCCLVDLDYMFTNGFKMGAADVESPKGITTAAALTAQVIAQVASSQYGGTTIGDIDLVLSPYVILTRDKHVADARKYGIADIEGYVEELTVRDVDSAMQGLLYEVNTLHTSNGQSPFVTFGFGMGESWEARLIQQGILKNQIRGLGKRGSTPVFPKLVFAVKDGLNLKKGDPNYDIKQLALECAAKRMYPDFLSYEKNLEITGSDKITYPMGCRAFLSAWKDPETGGFVTHGRNNLGVVSLNLPRIAIKSGPNLSLFYSLLDQQLAVCKEALMARIDSLRGVKASVAPILYTEGALGVKLNPDDDILPLFQNGRASISLGYIGVHETLHHLMPTIEHPFESEEAQMLAKHIVQYLKDHTVLWKEQTGFGFTLYSTPSESLCDRFCRLDIEKFGNIEKVTDKGYYTNSFHLDVLKKVSPIEKFNFEAIFHKIANGGHISYAEYPDMKNNLKGLEACIDYAMSVGGYFGTNTPVDECYKCGYDGEFTASKEGYKCPVCGNKDQETISVIRRTCGYLGNVGSIPYIEGKQSEVINRVKHC